MPVKQKHDIRLAAALTLLAASACNNPPDEETYIRNPNPGSIDPFCRWEDPPSPPEGSVAHRIGVSISLGDRSTCEEFEAEEVDNLLYAEYENSVVVEGCNPEPFELLRGCFDANGDRCAFSAYFFSRCPLTTSR